MADDAIGNPPGGAQHALVERAEHDRHIERPKHRSLDRRINGVELAFEAHRLHLVGGKKRTDGTDHFLHTAKRRVERSREP